jgi:hypothetical protein
MRSVALRKSATGYVKSVGWKIRTPSCSFTRHIFWPQLVQRFPRRFRYLDPLGSRSTSSYRDYTVSGPLRSVPIFHSSTLLPGTYEVPPLWLSFLFDSEESSKTGLPSGVADDDAASWFLFQLGSAICSASMRRAGSIPLRFDKHIEWPLSFEEEFVD